MSGWLHFHFPLITSLHSVSFSLSISIHGTVAVLGTALGTLSTLRNKQKADKISPIMETFHVCQIKNKCYNIYCCSGFIWLCSWYTVTLPGCVRSIHAYLLSALCILGSSYLWIEPATDYVALPVVFTIEKYLHVSGPGQFKPSLFRVNCSWPTVIGLGLTITCVVNYCHKCYKENGIRKIRESQVGAAT